MNKPVKDAIELKPIVEKAVKALIIHTQLLK